MAEPSFSPQFEQYLNPESWSGHMISDGDVKPREFGPADRQSNRYAREVLEDRLPMMQTFTPMQRFEKGMLFDAGEHPDGTITVYKERSLVTLSQRDARSIERSQGQHAIEPALDLNLRLEEGRSKVVVENGLMYVTRTLWGVVSRTRRGEPAIVSFAQGNVYRTSSSSVEVVIRDLTPKKPSFRIGQTEHFSFGKDHEGLEKISQLYICGYGKAKKAQKTGMQLVNSLIPKPVMTNPVLGISNKSDN